MKQKTRTEDDLPLDEPSGLNRSLTSPHERHGRQAKVELRRADGAEEVTFERHLSVEELAALWGMSEDFVRRLFLKEPGVVVFFNHRPGKRVYRTLRIPESIALRVHRRMVVQLAQTR